MSINNQHYTKSTVQAKLYCRKCGDWTMHRVDGGRKGPCLKCMARWERILKQPKPVPAPKQEEMFWCAPAAVADDDKQFRTPGKSTELLAEFWANPVAFMRRHYK